MKVTFKTGSEANYGSTNGEMFFASDTKQLLLNGVKYIPKKLSELTNDSGFLTSITKSMVENVLTGNITSHTHQYAASPSINGAATWLYGKYTGSGGRQNPDYFGKNKVGALMMNTVVNGNSQYKDWIISDCYTESDVGGAVAFGVNRQSLGAYIMRSAAERTEWAESAELLGTHNYASYALPLSGGTLTGNLTCNGSYISMNGSSGTKGYRGYFNNSKSDRAAGSHIFQSNGFAYGTNATSIGYAAYAGIRNTDSDSGTYPYLHWQWMDCLQVKETTSGTAVNCYGAILNNSGGKKDTAKFTVCVDGVCKFYDENKGDNDPTNQFLKFTNTNTSYGRVVVFIVDTGNLIFGGNTSHPRNMCNLKIGNMILGQGCQIKDVASMTINGKTVYRLAIYWWSGTLSNDYDITKATTAMVCTKVNNSNYSGASSYASGQYSVASGYFSVASGYYSVASSIFSTASGAYSVSSGNASMASGAYSVASGNASVASGASSVASSIYSTASGAYSVASGYSSVASGIFSVASGDYSVASGYTSVAKHNHSKVYATSGISGADYQTVLGRDNAETSGAVVVGWGTSDTARKNIFVLDTNGNATFGSGGTASVTAATFNGSLNGTATNASKLSSHSVTDLVYRTIYPIDAVGILIKTDVVAASNTMVNVHIWGNSYFKLSPIDTYIQFYNYKDNDEIISCGCTHLGYNFGDVYVFIYKSLVHIWFDVSGTGYPTINAFVGVGANGGTYNHITSITKSSKPTSGISREKVITPKVNAFTDSNVATATKLQTPRTFTVGGTSRSFDGSADISFALDDIITNKSHINVGSINVSDGLESYNVTIKNHLELGTNADVSGLTPSKIGAAAASHTHTFGDLSGVAAASHTHLYAGSASAGGAATSAVKLNTARKLWGQSFDGSADIDGSITLSTSEVSVSISRGIRDTSTSGFIGFRYPSLADTDKFSGICLGWDNNPTSADASLRINSSTFAYKGNTVWHGGNLKLGYTSSGLSRAVQKDSSNNLYVVAPSLFEQGISNNYPKNLRWITEDEGQLAFDTEVTAGTTSTVQVGIPVAHETSKGFMKSISTVTDVTGYTPCPVVSGTPYYKLDAIELDYTDLGIVSGSIESNVPINTTIQQDGNLGHLLNYTVDNIPRLLTISEGNFCKYFFWLQQTDDDTPIVAYYHCQFNDLWLVIDSPNMEVRISQGSF